MYYEDLNRKKNYRKKSREIQFFTKFFLPLPIEWARKILWIQAKNVRNGMNLSFWFHAKILILFGKIYSENYFTCFFCQILVHLSTQSVIFFASGFLSKEARFTFILNKKVIPNNEKKTIFLWQRFCMFWKTNIAQRVRSQL